MASFCHQVCSEKTFFFPSPSLKTFFNLRMPHLLNFISDELHFDAKCDLFLGGKCGLFVTLFLAKMLGTFLNRLMVKEADSDKSHNP